jgi:hypothetical protein
MPDVAATCSSRDDRRPRKVPATTGTAPTDHTDGIVERFLDDPDSLRFPQDLGHSMLTVQAANEIMRYCENPDDETAEPSYPRVYYYCRQFMQAGHTPDLIHPIKT